MKESISLQAQQELKNKKQTWSFFTDRVLLPQGCRVNTSRYLILTTGFLGVSDIQMEDERLSQCEAIKWLCPQESYTTITIKWGVNGVKNQ